MKHYSNGLASTQRKAVAVRGIGKIIPFAREGNRSGKQFPNSYRVSGRGAWCQLFLAIRWQLGPNLSRFRTPPIRPQQG